MLYFSRRVAGQLSCRTAVLVLLCSLRIALQSSCLPTVFVLLCSFLFAQQSSCFTAVFVFHCSLHVTLQSSCCSAVFMLFCGLRIALQSLCCSAVFVLQSSCCRGSCRVILPVSRHATVRVQLHPANFAISMDKNNPSTPFRAPFFFSLPRQQIPGTSYIPSTRNKIYTKYQTETFLQLPGINYLPASTDIRKA